MDFIWPVIEGGIFLGKPEYLSFPLNVSIDSVYSARVDLWMAGIWYWYIHGCGNNEFSISINNENSRILYPKFLWLCEVLWTFQCTSVWEIDVCQFLLLGVEKKYIYIRINSGYSNFKRTLFYSVWNPNWTSRMYNVP